MMKPSRTDVQPGLASLSPALGTLLHQLRIHRNAAEVWGFSRLAGELARQFETASRQLDSVMQRVLAQEQRVELEPFGLVRIGQTVEDILVSEREKAIEVVELAQRFGARLLSAGEGGGTSASVHLDRRVLELVLTTQEERVLYFDQQLALLRQLGTQNYLTTLV